MDDDKTKATTMKNNLEDFRAGILRSKMIRRKKHTTKTKPLAKHKDQKVLYQAMLTRKDKRVREIIKQQHDSEERFNRRMKEINEALHE